LNDIIEDNILKFESSVPPSTNHYNNWRAVPTGKFKLVKGKKERIYIPMAYPSDDYKKFKKEFHPYLKKIVEEYNWDIQPTIYTHYYLDIIMYFDRIDKDSNNYFKCPLDVGNTIIYQDDKTIIARTKRVYYTYNEELKPHFEYELYPVDYIGIWESEEEYNQFIEKCKVCKNYKEGKCKRLSEYLAYKITKDFDIKTRCCLGFKEIKVKK